MKIALIGATGRVGTRLLDEALRRGHTVTALMRDASKLPQLSRVTPVQLDVNDTSALARALVGHDAVLHALNPYDRDSAEVRARNQRVATLCIVAAMKAAGVRRLLAVGGAGTLKHEGVQFMDHPSFPADWRGGARATSVINQLLYEERDLDWTILSPAHWFRPGARTDTFRLGNDELLVGADGESRISMEDYAIAMIDELEHPKHIRRRFCVGY
jgi:putative NADH-flavin reductase